MFIKRMKTAPLALLLALIVILSCCSGEPNSAVPSYAQSPAATDAPPSDTVPSDTGETSSDTESNPDGTPSDTDAPPSDAESNTDAPSPDAAPSDPDGTPSESGEQPPESAPHVLMPDPISVVSEEAENCPAFGSEFLRGEIASITFLSDPSKAADSAWDVSEARDGSVLAWTLKTRPPFDLYIAAENAVTAPENCEAMFCGYSNLTRINFEAPFDTSRAVDMSSLFDSCVSLTDLDVSGFDTSSVTDMESMFRHCDALQTLDVSGFDTSRVTDMRSMFRRCVSLKTLDISGFDMSNVTDVRWMFAECGALRDFKRGDFDFASVEFHDDYMKNVPIRFSAIPLTGTPGFDEPRNYPALFDGDTNTKWCLLFQNVAYVEWKMPSPGSVAHLSLTSADNHDQYPGRNPGSWRLLGTDAANRRNGVWTVIGEAVSSGFEERDADNYLTHTTEFSGVAPAFQYYRLEITSTTGAEILQLSEIDMDYR